MKPIKLSHGADVGALVSAGVNVGDTVKVSYKVHSVGRVTCKVTLKQHNNTMYLEIAPRKAA